MDQGVRAVFEDYAVTAALVLVSMTYVPWVSARPPVDPARPVGIVEQPCAIPSSSSSSQISSDTDRSGKDWHERVLDPGGGRDIEPPPDANAVNVAHAAEEDRLHNDWAQLCRYRQENAALHRPSGPRVVFMGDSITELWKVAHPDFFGETYIDRGISGQTTAQMLVRFRQDVIALKPTVVHILGGTNDIAGNGGPTTLEAIKKQHPLHGRSRHGKRYPCCPGLDSSGWHVSVATLGDRAG